MRGKVLDSRLCATVQNEELLLLSTSGWKEREGGGGGGVLYVTFDNVGVSQAGVCGLTRTDTRPPSYSEGHFVLKERY